MKPAFPPAALIVAILSLASLLLPMQTGAEEATPLDWAAPNGRFFTQANGFPPGSSPRGYYITDEAGVSLWSEFVRLGGVGALGYPASQRFVWDGFTSQVVQKGVLQWHPEMKRVLMVNVFDILHDRGHDNWLLNFRSTPGPLAPDFDKGFTWNEIIANRQALVEARPAIRAAYWAVQDPLTFYGLPTSRITEMSDSYVIRLQRAVIQEWKTDKPWAKAGQVTVGNGGDIAKEAGLFSFKTVYPQDPAAGTWTPANYRVTGLATWYGNEFHGRRMANGEVYDQNNPTTTASNMYPLGTRLKVTNKVTGAGVVVRVTDTGTFRYPIVVDLSKAAFALLAKPEVGRIQVQVEVVG